ncbi:uncharacterized protein BYT42DRAFT_611581 [Radiomyces spectabilis]|uniref:uncharacterized protein n=1 Tax=Radiomyces spectabilis TaxID=64574 RepID=UPI002220F18B|nr:uncharacterized protein BYT42DRAFT_611581 [Radiomyces spectabilis]KAI8388548.1 hypothetical protein BYT42DRAFT_611581 [Radiomyces spectabilis]
MSDPFRYYIAPPIDWSDDQLDTFRAIMDTFIASLTPEEEENLAKNLSNTGLHNRQDIREFAQLSCTSLETLDSIKAFVNRAVAPEKRQELGMLLSLLSTRAGTFALTGHFTEFKLLSRQEREKVFLNWKDSFLPQLRLIYKTFFAITCHPSYGAKSSVLHRGMGYPGLDVARSHPDYKPFKEHERLRMMSLEDLQPDLEFDAIVIGSGAGGGVTAAELAKAGKSVLVIDKGTYYHASELELHEASAFANLYEHGGFFSSGEGSINILAGSTFGGGTTVNWSASLKLQHFVREEWAKQGLSHFLSPKFAKDLDRVFERIGASTDGIKHNGPNQILVDGCKQLGFPVADLHQNTDGQAHACNWCFAGCKDGIKNGTVNSWLRDANDHGARFLDRTKVLRVVTEKGVAVGVEAVVQYSHHVTIRAKQVVVAGGSLQSPGILLRSGLTNKNIGRHLRLHPCSITFGFFDRNIDMFEGSIMTAVSNVAENVDHEGYGAKLEVPCLHPGSFATVLPWRGAAHHKELMMRYRQCAPILILARDKDSTGAVRYDEHNNLIVDFALSTHDRQSILAGIDRSLLVLVAAGARELHTGQFGVEPFKFEPDEESRVDNPRFMQWRQKVLKYGLPQDGAGVFCAHQMGTCRMGISPKVSVTKPTGETWEVKNLYVSDASLFPSASGVNPMVTTEALALHVADTILKTSDTSTAAKL